MASDWITTEEAAELSGYHPHYVRKLVRDGEVKGQKIFTVWQVSRQSLLDYLRRAESLGEKRGPKTST